MKITDKIVTLVELPSMPNVMWHNPETGELKMFGNKGWEVVGGIPGEGSNVNSAIIPITYTELVKLRDDKQLIVGLYYKIIDYLTSVSPLLTGYKSANHLFDIIVQAIDKDLLATQARASRHEGDTYFENSDLNKWVLHYTLDNVNWSSTDNPILVNNYGGKLILESDLQVSSEIKKLITQSVYEAYNVYDEFYIDDKPCTTPEEFLTNLFNTYKYIAYDEYYEYFYLFNDISINNTISCYEYDMYGYFYQYEVQLSNVIQPQAGTGCITYMEDEHHNSAYYDFKNILMARYTDFEFSTDIDASVIEDTNPLEVLTYYGCHESTWLTNINYESIQWHYTLSNVWNDPCDDTINRLFSNRFVITGAYPSSLPNIVIYTVNWTPNTYFIDNSRDLTLSSHGNGLSGGTSHCYITNSRDIIESVSYSGGNNYTSCDSILNLRLRDCIFSNVRYFVGACNMYSTQLTSIHDVTLITNLRNSLGYSSVVGLHNLDIKQSSIFSNTKSPKILMQNNTNDGIKVIDFANL